MNTVAETNFYNNVQHRSLVTLSKSLSQTKLSRKDIDAFLKKCLNGYDRSRSKTCSEYVDKLTDEKIEGNLLERFIESINNPNLTKEEVNQLALVGRITIHNNCKRFTDNKNHLCDGNCTIEMMEQIIKEINALDKVKENVNLSFRKCLK